MVVCVGGEVRLCSVGVGIFFGDVLFGGGGVKIKTLGVGGHIFHRVLGEGGGVGVRSDVFHWFLLSLKVIA